MKIRLKKLEKIFDKNLLFKTDFLEFKRNNVYAVIGENGAGKSTLLRMISGLDKDYKGSIDFIENNNKISLNNREKYIIYTHQKPYMFDLSVKDNINIGKKLDKNSEPIKDIRELINMFNINNILFKSAKNISGGEAQKVSFIRALSQGGKVILLDEPTSGMDIESTKTFEKVILEIKNNRIVVIITHNILQALRVSDYIIEFNNKNIAILETSKAREDNRIKEIIKYVSTI